MSDIVSYCRTSSSSVRQSNHSPQAQRSGACAHAQAPGGPKLGRLLWRWRLLRGGSRTEMGRVGVVDHGLSHAYPIVPTVDDWFSSDTKSKMLSLFPFPCWWSLTVYHITISVMVLSSLIMFNTIFLLITYHSASHDPPPQGPDLMGHCRTSTASCRSQWALPGLNSELQISVGHAGPQQRAPD